MYPVVELSSPPRSAFARALAIGTSALAIACAQPAWAQDVPVQDPAPSDQLEPGAKLDGDGTAGTFSGSADPQAGSTPPVAGSAGGTSGVAGTQDTPAAAPDTARDEIVVTGIRQSLANAQNIKRNADTVVDAITAQDIGSLPDRSVNEALQRVPGVTISRFAAPTDSAHFSAQGAGVVVRGLGYVRGEFNGRDTFAVGGGREIGFNDIPSEIVGSIEVYKNATADLIEGGIAGTVNINTRKPFDTNTDLLFLSGSINWGDLEQRAAPQAVGLFSKQFNTAGGSRFGVLGSVTYSQFRSRSDSTFVESFLPRFNDDTNGNGTQDAGEGRVINAGTPFQSTLFDTYPVPDGFDRVYVPLGGGNRIQRFDRERFAIVGALQFENADRNFLVTAQYTRAESKESWLERTEQNNVYYGDVSTVFPVGGVTPTYDENGIFTSGRLGKRTGAVFGNAPNGFDFDGDGALDRNGDGSLVTYGPYTRLFAPDGIFNAFSNRYFYSKSTVEDIDFNVKWEPTDRLRLNFDGQYITSKLNANDDILDIGTFGQINMDLTQSIPNIVIYAPDRDTASYLANPNSLYFRDAFNNRAINDGEEYAFRGDAEYDFGEESFLRAARVGGRYAKRDQTVRTNDYNNWGFVSEVWNTGPVTTAALSPAEYELFSYDRFMRGQATSVPATSYVKGSVIADHEQFTDLLRRVTAQGGGSYTPLQDRTRADGEELVAGYFLPNEVYDNSEETWAAYARVDFGVDNIGGGDMSLSGNIGLRYVHTNDASAGALTLPRFEQIVPAPGNDANGAPLYQQNIPSYCAYQLSRPVAGTIPAICTVSADQQAAIAAFANGASYPDNARQSYDDWLPSLNLKLQITPTLLTRFAASRAISRPNFGDLRNYVGVNPGSGLAAGTFGFTASSRNPFLQPIRANQFDLTAEWYFAKVGSLTGSLFYKELTDIILDNAGYTRTISNNGQTFDIAVNGPANADGKGKVKGFELAYQQTYDFLPGALRGLGLQATYTFVDPSNIPNGIPANGAGDGARPPLDVTGIYDNLPLAGLSRHSFNIAGFYDLGGIYTRFAYNWRSDFLLTNRDCCFPYLPVYSQSTGTLDGSFFYTVNRNFKLGVEAQNILDTTTRTEFVLNPEGLRAPRSFFKNDRSFTISARITY